MKEWTYGFFPGGHFDPRLFVPDEDTNTRAELDAHRAACKAADRAEWLCSPLGGKLTERGFEDGHAFGLGSYEVDVGPPTDGGSEVDVSFWIEATSAKKRSA